MSMTPRSYLRDGVVSCAGQANSHRVREDE
jgi:hypothetical protein